MSPTSCPHCGHDFLQIPARKRRCPSCKENVYPRRAPGEDSKRLVTEAEAGAIEQVWAAHQYRVTWLRNLTRFGVSDADLEKEVRRLGQGFSEADAFWALMNRAATSILARGDLASANSLYFLMGLFCVQEGREARSLFEEAARLELRHMQSMGVGRVAVSTAGPKHSCASCNAISGRTYPIAEAPEDLPVPNPSCTSHYGYCRCLWTAAPSR